MAGLVQKCVNPLLMFNLKLSNIHQKKCLLDPSL